VEELSFKQKVELIRRVYAEWTRPAYAAEGEVELTAFHLEAEVRDPSRPDRLDPSGVYRGREGIRRYVEEWYESWEQFELAPEEFVAFGKRVVVHVRASGRARASGIELRNERFHVFGFENGKISSLEIHPDLAAARQAAQRALSSPDR
jgi:ketosteroid isomerase-like protein